MWSRYSSGRQVEAWRMLERAVTEMITVPSKLAETSEPLRVSRTPVLLAISRPKRRRGKGCRPGMATGCRSAAVKPHGTEETEGSKGVS